MNEKCNKCWSLNEEDFFDDWFVLIAEIEQEVECFWLFLEKPYYRKWEE